MKRTTTLTQNKKSSTQNTTKESNMYRGSQQFGNRYDRDESRYDDFYRGGAASRGGRSGGAARDWDNSRDRGFFNRNEGGSVARRDDRGGHAAGMMAALQAQQTQTMLAALSQANNFSRSGLLPTPGRYQDRDRRGGRGGGGDRRGGGPRPGEKRRGEPPQSNYGKQRDRRPPPKTEKPKPKPKEEKKEKEKEEEIPTITEADIPDDEVEISDDLMDKVEKLRQREKVERNVADEDIGKLVVFCYTGKGYHCSSCNVYLTKEAGFQHHIQGKSHVMNVIDARGGDGAKYAEVRSVLDIDLVSDDWFENSEKARSILLKQAKQMLIAQKELEAKAMLNFNKEPSNFFKCDFNARKTAKKSGDTMTFSHLVETTMVVKDFTGDKFFGCEFVKAESGFNCRLCDMYIKDHKNVITHIASKNHKNMYANFLKKNPNYETKQKQQNIDLAEALAIEEDKYVVLHETKANEGEKIFIDHCETLCTRIPDLLVAKEEENKKKAEAEAKAAEEEEAAKKVEEGSEAPAKEDQIETEEAEAEKAVEEEGKEEKTEENAEETTEKAEDEDAVEETEAAEVAEEDTEEAMEAEEAGEEPAEEVTEEEAAEEEVVEEIADEEPADEPEAEEPEAEAEAEEPEAEAEAEEPEAEEPEAEPEAEEPETEEPEAEAEEEPEAETEVEEPVVVKKPVAKKEPAKEAEKKVTPAKRGARGGRGGARGRGK